MEQPCGKRMKAMLNDWIGPWENKHGSIYKQSRRNILSVSSEKVDKALSLFKTQETKSNTRKDINGPKA